MLKYFPGNREVIGTIVIPTAILIVLLLLPLLDRVLPRQARPLPGLRLRLRLVGGAGYLTVEALQDDADERAVPGGPRRRPTRRASGRSSWPRPRRRHPARRGRPTSCAATRSPRAGGAGARSAWAATSSTARGPASRSASDLKDFGSRAWIRGLLENPKSPAYFGKVAAVRRHGRVEEELEARRAKQLDDVADFVASFAADPRRHDARRMARTARASPSTPGSSRSRRNAARATSIEGFTEGGTARRPEPLRLGLAPVDRPDDPQAGGRRPLRLPRARSRPDARLRPDQVTDNDVNMVDPLPQGRLSHAGRRRDRRNRASASPTSPPDRRDRPVGPRAVGPSRRDLSSRCASAIGRAPPRLDRPELDRARSADCAHSASRSDGPQIRRKNAGIPADFS